MAGYTYSASFDQRDANRVLIKLMGLLSPSGLMAFMNINVGPHLANRAGVRFRSEGDAGVGNWIPLKDATIAMRAEQGYPAGPINRRSGELENFVVRGGWAAYPTGAGASLRYPSKTPGGELKTKVATAQGGKPFPSTPPRPVLNLDEKDLLFVQTSMAFAINEAMR